MHVIYYLVERLVPSIYGSVETLYQFLELNIGFHLDYRALVRL